MAVVPTHTHNKIPPTNPKAATTTMQRRRTVAPSMPMLQQWDVMSMVVRRHPALSRSTANSKSGQNVEMEPLTGGGQYGGRADPNAILNECMEINKGIEFIDQQLQNLQFLQGKSLNEADNTSTSREIDSMNAETMALYREYAGRIKRLKQMPESGSPKNAPQLGMVDRKLKSQIRKYQEVEAAFRKDLEKQMARQYRIVRPDASEAEVREAVEDTSNRQVFSQALMQSDRRGQAQSALRAVESRHVAIQKIEQDMIQLAELFQEMEALVVHQEESVTLIEQKGEEVQENMHKGVEEVGVAITSARARNKKKWWCLGICSMSIVFSPISILILTFVLQFSLFSSLSSSSLFTLKSSTRSPPSAAWTPQHLPHVMLSRASTFLERSVLFPQIWYGKVGRPLSPEPSSLENGAALCQNKTWTHFCSHFYQFREHNLSLMYSALSLVIH
jgi:syntaxin 1B/2/3